MFRFIESLPSISDFLCLWTSTARFQWFLLLCDLRHSSSSRLHAGSAHSWHFSSLKYRNKFKSNLTNKRMVSSVSKLYSFNSHLFCKWLNDSLRFLLKRQLKCKAYYREKQTCTTSMGGLISHIFSSCPEADWRHSTNFDMSAGSRCISISAFCREELLL